MNKSIQNIFAVVAGIVIGSTLNMGIISISSLIIPPPKGVDLSSMDSLIKNMHLFKPVQFMMPFIAHALGTFVGAFFTAFIAKTYRRSFALVIGVFFLIGGGINVFVLPSPLWFDILDLSLAYIPMALLAYLLSLKLKAE